MRFLPSLFLLLACMGFASVALAQDEFAGDAEYVGEANVTFTTIDVPGAVSTDVTGINNNGEMVGIYTLGGQTDLGFAYLGGSFTSIRYPGSNITTQVGAVNDSGVIAGTALNTRNFTSVGFLYDGSTFTTIKVPGKQDPYADGVNNDGVVVGGVGVEGAGQCYELIGTKLKNVTPPPGGDFVLAYATGVNNLGEVAGWTTASTTTSFVYKGGKFRTLVVPGSTDYTEAWGINDGGAVVGWYESCDPSCAIHGFALIEGKYVSLNYPGASETLAFGINNAGEVVGAYMLNNVTHGFVTTPITAADIQLEAEGRAELR